MSEISYKPLAIKNLKESDADLLAAVVKICKTAVWLKRHVSVDSEWDYKIGIPFTHYTKDIEHLAQMPTGLDAKNTYQGDLTIDNLIDEFSEFNDLLGSTYPLGEEDADFILSYGFLEGRLNFLKTILSPIQKNKRPENIEQKIDWGKWGTIATVASILVAIGLAFLAH